jgi:M6 family metalloprotease-like protein
MHRPVKTASFNLYHIQSGRCMFFGFVFMLAVALYLLFSPIRLWAAPFAKYFQFTQPDGVQLTLWGEGDEFHAVFETTTGYTVVFDPQQKAYFYAKRATNGKSLIPSDVLAHNPVPPGLAQHVRMDHDAVVAAARVRQKQWDADTGLSKRWSRLKSQTLGTPLTPDEVGVLPAPPETPTIGTKIGLTLLIDFSDAPATISQTEIEGFLNGDTYTGFGNNGSVKKYFSDVSGSRLTYTNVVTIYVRMTQPKNYYNDTSEDCGIQGRLLINDALAILKARSDYNSTILPTFSSLTTDGSGNVVAFNVFFAGADSGVWSYGLWPHSWVLASPVPLGNGKSVYAYQITNVGTSLTLGTFSHENGHMLCDFPDIYDYDYDSMGGAGVFCLMNSGGHGTNPSQVFEARCGVGDGDRPGQRLKLDRNTRGCAK